MAQQLQARRRKKKKGKTITSNLGEARGKGRRGRPAQCGHAQCHIDFNINTTSFRSIPTTAPCGAKKRSLHTYREVMEDGTCVCPKRKRGKKDVVDNCGSSRSESPQCRQFNSDVPQYVSACPSWKKEGRKKGPCAETKYLCGGSVLRTWVLENDKECCSKMICDGEVGASLCNDVITTF